MSSRWRYHGRAQVLGLFLQDTHYRNQFETSTSRGTLNATARQQWEATLFGDAYKSAAPSTRPKYGVVNYDHDYLGCKRARTQYGKPTISDLYPRERLQPGRSGDARWATGEAFLVLQNVEDRVTFSWGDSGNLANAHGAAAAARGGGGGGGARTVCSNRPRFP